MKTSPLQVLYEDNHCLAVVKPARVLVAGDSTGDFTLLDQAKSYLKQKYGKPGNVFLGVVHRLDRPVSGVVLYARTSKAAARLSRQFADQQVEKVYWAIVEGRLPEHLHCEDYLLKDRQTNEVRIVDADTPGSRRALLDFRRVRNLGDCALVEVRPQTGRSHQIRVQLSTRGFPICGDTKYGASPGWRGAIALHARALTFEHPTRHEAVTVSAEPPGTWRALLGGGGAAGSVG